MVSIKTVISEMRKKSLGGIKIPHSISNPVLRMENGKPCIASFTYVYNRENLECKKMPRPTAWMLADIENGMVICEYRCSEKDFSTASFGELFDLNDPNLVIPTQDDFAEIYRIFDEIRSAYLETGSVPAEQYQIYLRRILEVTPAAFRRFYTELSNI